MVCVHAESCWVERSFACSVSERECQKYELQLLGSALQRRQPPWHLGLLTGKGDANGGLVGEGEELLT